MSQKRKEKKKEKQCVQDASSAQFHVAYLLTLGVIYRSSLWLPQACATFCPGASLLQPHGAPSRLTTLRHCSPGSVMVSTPYRTTLDPGDKVQGENIPLFRVLDNSGVLSAQLLRATFMNQNPCCPQSRSARQHTLGLAFHTPLFHSSQSLLPFLVRFPNSATCTQAPATGSAL